MVLGAVHRTFLIGLLAAGAGLAGHTQASAMSGALAGPSAEHAAVGVLERGGVPSCTAALVGPGWALTAAHCLDEQPRGFRLLAGTDRVLAVGKAHRSPDGGDLALLEIPEAAALALPHLALPAPLTNCRLEPRGVIAIGAAHAGTGTLTRTGAGAGLSLYEECNPQRFSPMLLAPEGTPVSLCSGDSGMPVVERSDTAATIQAVVVSQVMGQGRPGCGRDHFAIGFVEPVRTEGRLAWLSKAARAPRAPRAFAASASRAEGARMRVRLPAWQAAPPPGARVMLVARGGRVWSAATVARSGAVMLKRPPPGIYRLRFTGAAGTQWSTPIRMR